ncbi:hypothetical protein GLOIN_2v1761431 [Rhizophagus irregularis DAOM 181602=DAOM 197198]|nr:hypothetical protein GLOIN_2v1761431 [Rhizophagus irregularis DAOM 181602=DAOM 197198]
MSLDTFRNEILSNSDEGRVQVNQRDLIDKILARYSCKFVIFRELMQNSDDAESSSAKIIFETNGNKITRIIFKNNGFAFRPEDWERLVRIAEGNPDEQKIGAFGVGFYSLFAVTENPFVSSGGQGMAFYWRGKQIFTKQGPIDDGDDKGWTTFLMDTREPLVIPNIEELSKFLVNSLGFTDNLKEISMYIDNKLVIKLSKKMQDPESIDITSRFNTFSSKNMFNLTSVDLRCVQLDVERLLLPKKINIKHLRSDEYNTEEASAIFRIAKGSLNVKISKEFSAKMGRITKKSPPNNTSIQMIFTEFDERNTSKDYYKNLSPIFEDLISYPEQGKIYIGFPTNQTTGSSSHLAARVIPTMERELIDFAEQTLAEYNIEMLCLGGTLSRILYEYEMAQMSNFCNEIISSNIENNEEYEETKQPKKRAPEPKMKRSLYRWLTKRFKSSNHANYTPTMQLTSSHRQLLEKWAAHAITHFTYNASTPNVRVSEIAEKQFFNCLEQNLLILSTNGVHPITDVRLPNPEMAGFIKTVPLVPKNLLEQCETFFNKAKGANFITELSFEDVLVELKSRALSEEEIIKLLKWWISYLSKGNPYDTRLLTFTQFGDSSQTLDTIKFYLNPHKISSDIDIPFEVIPYIISKNFTQQELTNGLKWKELPLVNWANFIVNDPGLETDPKFAEKIHHVLAKNLESIPQQDKETIRLSFIAKRCIPTKFGMKFPNESYFEDVNLFPNLPTIKFQNSTSGIRFLMGHFGVRKIVELKLILERLVNQEDCNFVGVVKYLASIYDELKDNEKNILKNESIWPKEDLLGSQTTKKIQRFVARDLYVPIRSLRELGLSIIDWNAEWSNSSKGGKFLIELGLQEYPKLETILNLAVFSNDPKIRELALKYFIDNYDKYSVHYKPAEINIAFLPCSTFNTYAKPSECFTNDRCIIMNFKVIREDLRSKAEKFGIQQHPNHDKLVKRLTENPPQGENNAMKVFEYLYSRQHDFTDADWNILNNSEFIPIKNENKHIKPRDCFFKLKDEKLNEFFLCVDFGTKANEFLSKCGVKKQTSNDFAEIKVDPSHKLWKLYVEKFPVILENINPNLEKILNLAAPPTDLKLRTTALKYFIDNFDRKYVGVYNPGTVNIAFLPCSNSNAYASPSDCFINDECMIMNFQIIRKDLRSKAEKFGVQQNPDYKKLTEKLIENPPQNKNEAKKVFEYLNKFNYNWNTLINSQFIPIQDENSPNNKYIKPNDCFFKLKDDILNEFFLCVDFGTKANRFLAKCGIKEPSSYDFAGLSVDPSHKLWKLYVEKYPVILEKINPNLEKILKLAAPPINPKLRAMALKYFIDNFKKKYVKNYKPEEINITFLPCSNSDTCAKPSDCFINDECKIMGFKIIREDLRSKAVDFGIHQNPNCAKLIERLTENPPKSDDVAKKVFEYLNTQQKCFVNSDWKKLENLKFIPIQYESQPNKLFNPRECFFKLKEESLNNFFPCVDLGTKANEFLAKCGVREPSSYDFAEISVDPSHELWKLYVEKYPVILEKINPNLEKILKLATPPTNPKLHAMALKYFVDNFDKKYVENYKPEEIDIAFLPCSNSNSYAKHSECFINDECFIDSDWKMLKDLEFIPIQHDKLIKPRDCFLKLKEESLNNFFTYIDFGTKANEFLAKCGVREPSSNDFAEISVDPSHELWNLYVEKYPIILEKINPNLVKILKLATPPTNPKLHAMALKYFVDNFDKKYVKNYKPEEIDIAFLPCSNSNSYAKHSECFINDECKIMGFNIIRQDLRSKAGDFGVRQNPNRGFIDSDWKMLKDLEFIPIQHDELIKPRDCFLKLKEESLSNFFTYVDFGTKANEFLAKCGVREPSSYDFAEISVDPSHKLWNLYVEKYPIILEKINPNLEKILNLAAPPTNSKFRVMAIKYFIDNFDKKYAKVYKPEKINIAFIPCSNFDACTKPSDCFTNYRCMIMNFKIIHEDLRSKAGKFGVCQNPNRAKLINRLIESPPSNTNVAKEVFDYLNTQQESFTDSDWKKLENVKFIPIQSANKLVSPRDCFLKLKEESLDNFFLWVDFAGDFGVRQNPNREELINGLTENPPKSVNVAKEVFEYLNTQQEGFTDSDWKKLENVKFILIQSTNKFVSPRDCFLKLKEGSLDNFFLWHSECFINDKCKSIGFKIIREDLRSKARDFGVRQNPNREELIKGLTENPPKNVNVAKEAFEYLNTQQGGFTDSDWKKLENVKFILIQSTNKFVSPRDCFLKLKEGSLDNFFLWVDFGTKANEFLAKCGVKKPSSKYSKFYKPEEIDVAYLPCSNSNSYAKHSECFINDKCKIMGFNIIRQDLRSKAGEFGVRQNPNREELIKGLTENPPKNKNKAKEIFEYLNTQQESFTDSDWKKLKDFEFIPIQYESKLKKNINVDLIKPRDCYLKFNDKRLNDFLRCVDFGTNANKFLAKCGVNYDLLFEDAHRLLFKSSRELWDLCKKNTKNYLHILEKINDVYNKFPEKKLNKDDVLIAIKTDSEGNNNYCIATVKEIYINDDKVYHKNLNPFTPPENLRDFYKKLGCSSLHESVTKSVVPYGPIRKTKYSRQLQRIIRERASLLYLNNSEEHIRKDEKWLQKLKVREIEYMETSYKLGSITKNERNDMTTNISQKSTISWILYVTPNSNLIDISQQLVNHIFTSHYQNIPYFNTILTAPLSNLKNMGIIHPKLQNDQPPQSTSNTFSSKHNEDISSENTRDLRNFLQVTIKSRYSNSESNINSIKTCIDENKMNYCETMPGYSMHCVGNLQKIELYVPTDVDQSEILSQSRIAPLSQFIYMLKDLADVFKVTPKAIHIFYDNSVNSIAFNRDGALFFNLKFYLELHEQKCKTKPTIDAMTFWFTIYCHVLAHNFIQLHNSEFEYYYSSFAQTYIPDFFELMRKREIKFKTFNVKTFWKDFNRILNRN